LGGGSFQDAVRRRQAAGFVARADELARFRTNLALPADDPDRRFIFSVHGDGGVGKTFLTQRLRGIADGHGAATSYVDERVFGVPEAMRAIAADLSRCGEDMSGFDKLLRNYQERRSEVEADPDAPAGAATFFTKTAVRVGLHAAHAVPGVGGVVDSVDANAVAEQADKLRMFLGKKFRSHEDVRLLLSPAEALSPTFVAARARTAQRRPRALVLDTYEQTGTFLDGWLRSVLDGDYGELPEALIVTVAGRHALDPGNWANYASVLADVALAPFTEAEARQLLAAKGVTDERVVEVIINVSGRLPLLVAMLAENHPTDPSRVGDPSGDAVERFLKWETDVERRSLAVAAALPRVVSEDVLGVLTSGRELDDAERGRLFGWLRSLPFVTRDAGRCVYHEVVRTAMIRLERGQSPTRWRERHHALASTYRQWRTAAFTEDAWDDTGWFAYRIEEAYHLLCADPSGQLPATLTEMVYVIDSSLTNAVKWAQMIFQAGADRDAAAVLTWGRRLEEALRGSDDEAKVACLTLLLNEHKIAEKTVPVALRTRGRALYFLNRDDKALADLDAALKLVPGDKHALAYRGNCYRWLGRNDEAITDLNRSIEIDLDYAFAIGKRGQVFAQIGRYDEAITNFSRAIELDPSLDWAIAERGDTYRLTGQYDHAITDLTRAIELNPRLDWAIACRGMTYRETHQYDQAITDLTRAIELNPDHAWAITVRGETHRLTGQYDHAITDLTRAIELNPSYSGAIACRGITYRETHQYDQAITDLTRAIELNPDHAWAIAERGETYRLVGVCEQAIIDFSRAIELNPDYAWAMASRGQAYRQEFQCDQAISDFNRAIELDPSLDWVIAERGETYRLTGHYDQAITDLTRAIELNPDHAWAIGSRGQAYRQAHQYDQAISDFNRAIQLNPDHAWAIGSRGETYRLTRRYVEALADINRAVGLSENDDDWWLYQRSLVLACRGEQGEAARDAETAVRHISDQLATDKASANGQDAYNVAMYRAAGGELEQAHRDLAQAVERLPVRWRIHEAIDDLRDLSSVTGMDTAGITQLIELLEKAFESLGLPVLANVGHLGPRAAQQGDEDRVGAVAVRP
jgi:tetratricopeptide (TPR) repeat protein